MLRPLSGCLAALLLAASGCGPAPEEEVIAADGALCDLSRRLAAADLRVHCLLGPGDDPHQLQLRPDQSRRLRRARLLLINGYGLTPALEKQPGAVRVAELAVPGSPDLGAGRGAPEPRDQGAAHQHLHQHHDDPDDEPAGGEGPVHAHHHGDGDRDPHVWHDPRQAAAMVDLMSRRLQELRPEAASRIAARAKALRAGLEGLHRWNTEQFATLPPPRPLASGHRAFASLARAYGLRELSLLDADSASGSLRPRGLAAVVEELRRLRVRRLFSERLPPERNLLRISALSGVPIASRPLPADHGGEDLMDTLTANTCLIVEQQGGRCDQAGRRRLLEQWSAIR